MVVTDGSDDQAISYLTPMTYRASALAGADGALIGTTEHGVLGRRWIYDGIGDPILIGQLVALIQGQTKPQTQSVSDTPDPTVTCGPLAGGISLAVESAVAARRAAGHRVQFGLASKTAWAGTARRAGSSSSRLTGSCGPMSPVSTEARLARQIGDVCPAG